MGSELDGFLKKYGDSKKNESYEDEKITVKDKFWELWKEEDSKKLYSSPQSFVHLIRGSKFEADKLLMEFMRENLLKEGFKIVDDKLREENSARKERKEDKLKKPLGTLHDMLGIFYTIENQRENIATNNNLISNLKFEKKELLEAVNNKDQIIAKKEEEIAKLKKELEEQRRLNSLIAQDESQKVSENYGRIEKDLSFCYSLFLKAKDMTMNLDLGEVMRDQLRDVFNTLSNHGINMEDAK